MPHSNSNVRSITEDSNQTQKFERVCLETVLNSLDALVYVADMQTYELLFVSQYGQKLWGLPAAKKCYEYLQTGQTTPCSFCTNSKLLNAQGEAQEVLVWEFQNTVTQRWYQCRDQAIPWVDGRLVRLEVAVDITDSKLASEQLDAARKEAEALARIDPLTKTYNRRAFFENMALHLRYLQRHPQPFSLAMLDIDHFKQVNDCYGHAVGDQALIAVVQAVGASIRGVDQLYRIGGEEFVIALTDCSEAAAYDLLERVRHAIENVCLDVPDGALRLTCSFGVTEYRADSSADMLLREADEAMYAAKQQGRNRTCRYSQLALAST